jgi:cell division protein FtsW
MAEKIKKYFIYDISILVFIGLVMVWSSSWIVAKENLGSSLHFVSKQLIFLIIGSLGACALSKYTLVYWYNNISKINILTTVLLFLTFTPMGLVIKGSSRWLSIGGFSLQPGEFVKFSVMFCAINYFQNFKDYTRNDRLLYSLNLLIPLGLLIMQPDFGTFSITALLIAFIWFMSELPRKYFYSAMVAGIISGGALLVAAPYRVKRLLTFLDPWTDPQGAGFQIIQSYLAFVNGHIFGRGIGNSNEKLYYLPEAYNDFIFSVIGEELGLVGVIFVVLFYMVFVYLGFKLALTVKSKLNTQLISAIVFAIGFQAFLNMGVVLGLLPTKGLNLPFISYGGSSLVANLLALGLLFSALEPKSQVYDEAVEEDNSSFSYNG